MGKSNSSIRIPNGGHAVLAIYSEQSLPEYKENPLIESLPPILSFEQAEEMVHVYPDYDEKERSMETHERFHCVQRLFRYFQPWDKHFDIEQRISRVIRQGYLARNPLNTNYASDLQKIYRMIKEGNYQFNNCDLSQTSASGFTVIGFSGVGKTKAVERVLNLYPQIIAHSEYKNEAFIHYQLTWLKLDCPYDGSVKGLCTNFFMEIDRLLGDDSYNKYASGRNTTTDTMIPRMAQIARRHSLGVLVIDEIQHLSVAKSGGQEKMLNFFVTLVNKIGVPVILIGTTKAMSILQSEFRQARRGSGQQGDMIWENMSKNESWELLIEGMWDYQWTREAVPLSHELKDVLYDESQGIVDIAVKLYAMSQLRAIALGEETITPDVIRKVAKDNLQLVKPMLQALRSGDKVEIGKYDDIKPVDIDTFCEEHYTILNERLIKQKTTVRKKNQNIKLCEDAIDGLMEYGVDRDAASRAIQWVLEKTDNSLEVADIIKQALKKVLNDQKANAKKTKKEIKQMKTEFVPEDLRNIVEMGRKTNQSAYESLKVKGIIKNMVEEFSMLG